MHNAYMFLPTDIIVWNGVICQYGAINHLIVEGDTYHIAGEDEENQYRLKNL